MNKGGKTSTFIGKLISGSIFCKMADAFGTFLAKLVMGSCITKVLTTYPDMTKASNGSFFYKILKKPMATLKKLRLSFAKSVENSITSKWIWFVFDFIMRADLMSMGALFISFGFLVCVVQLYAAGYGIVLAMSGLAMQGGVISCLLGLVMLTSKQPLGNVLTDSAILRELLINWGGLRASTFRREKASRHILLFAIIGAMFGMATYYVHIVYVVFAIVAVIMSAVVMASPEAGLLATIVLLPFLPTIPLTLLSLYTTATFLFKAARGKRVIALEAVDLCVLGFAAVTGIFGGLTSVDVMSSLPAVALHVSYMLMYFVAANTIKSRRLVRKTVSAMLLAGFASGLMGIYQNIVGLESSVSWIDTEMFAEIGSRVIGPFDNPNVFGEYLVMLLPLAIGVTISQKGKLRLAGAISSASMLLALIYTWSRGAWLAAMITIAIMLLMYSSYLLKLGLPALVAVPFLPAVLPSSIVSRIMSIGDLADTSTAYRVSIWTASVRMIEDMFLPGIGMGSNVFLQVYPAYALSGASYALHAHNLFLQITIETGALGIILFAALLLMFFKTIFSCFYHVTEKETSTLILAVGMGIMAILIQGLTDYVWFNYRIVLSFWLFMGIAVGMSRSYFLKREDIQ